MTDAGEPATNSWDPEQYEGGHEYVYEYGRDVVDLLDPQAGERILDLGCGTGHLTNAIAEAVGEDGSVLGIDRSPEMIAEARANYPEIDFAVVDATEFDAEAPFDGVFSNAALHWIDDQDAVAERMAEALRPGGRFVAELGGRNNVNAIASALIEAVQDRGYDPEVPWYFPAIGKHASLLEAHGFETRFARLFDRPTDLAGGADGLRNWVETFGDALLADLDAEERAAVLADVEDALRDDLYDPESDTWSADYRRLRFVAVRE